MTIPKEIPLNHELDLPMRSEVRLVLPIESLPHVQSILDEYFEPKRFSEHPINRTIYFNNANHDVPWGYSLKARKYLDGRAFAEGSPLDMDDTYHADVKITTSIGQKAKSRQIMTLRQATEFFNVQYSMGNAAPLRPYVANEYERYHYQPRHDATGKVRVTCDVQPAYFRIDEDGIAHFLADEHVARVEFKTAPGFGSPALDRALQSVRELGAHATISKKMAAYTYEAWYLREHFGRTLQKELPGIEIESKLVVIDANPPHFFQQLEHVFRQGWKSFTTEHDYPFVVESGSINSYYLTADQDRSKGIKILARPTVAKVVRKTDEEIVATPSGLGCIIKRREEKGAYFPMQEHALRRVVEQEEARLATRLIRVGELERLRKAFWVMEQETQRRYHITMDRCQTDRDTFYELEVEYIGTAGTVSENAEAEIVQHIAELTHHIIDAFPDSVRPEPLTKLEWLQRQRN